MCVCVGKAPPRQLFFAETRRFWMVGFRIPQQAARAGAHVAILEGEGGAAVGACVSGFGWVAGQTAAFVRPLFWTKSAPRFFKYGVARSVRLSCFAAAAGFTIRYANPSACQCHDPCHANATQDHGRRIRAGHDDAAGARAGYAGHGAGDAGVCVYLCFREIDLFPARVSNYHCSPTKGLALGTACERGEITNERSYRPNGYGAGAVNPETESAAALPSRRGYKHPPVLICLYSELEDRRKNTPHSLAFRLGACLFRNIQKCDVFGRMFCLPRPFLPVCYPFSRLSAPCVWYDCCEVWPWERSMSVGYFARSRVGVLDTPTPLLTCIKPVKFEPSEKQISGAFFPCTV